MEKKRDINRLAPGIYTAFKNKGFNGLICACFKGNPKLNVAYLLWL